VQAYLLHISADILKAHGFEHPMGAQWRGFQDINPATLTRERILAFLAKVDTRAIRAVVPTGTPQQIARTLKGFADAGLRVPKILDYSGMAGLKFGARSAEKVREAEDEFMRLVQP
jgi:phthiodiolone/phenolphthiodiolone dimycocerosates ketoreductase